MPRFTFIFSFVFICMVGHAQYGFDRPIPREPNGDTSAWWNWADQWSQHLGIERLLNTEDSLHYRYWTNEQIVEVWKKPDGTLRGKVVDFAKTYTPYDFNTMSQKPSTYYSDFDLLSDSVTKAAYDLFRSIDTIPTEDSIKDWFQGLDGVSYEIEYTSGKNYSIRHYWTPQVQDTNLAEVKVMIHFVNAMNELVGLKSRYSAFAATLKPGSYSTDGYMIMRVLTKKQKKKAAKYARKHPTTE